MIPNIKYYVISIVSIFLALGIGIYIGFTLNSNNFLIEQKDDIVEKIEEKFDYLNNENLTLKKDIDKIKTENNMYKNYIENVHSEVIKDKLTNLNVAIIETNNDYIYSGVGKTLEIAGANVVSITTINDKVLNEDLLEKTYNDLKEENIKGNLIEKSIIDLTNRIIKGQDDEFIQALKEQEFIDIVGNYDTKVDYIIIAGGSNSENLNKISLIDNNIVDTSKKAEVPIIGIEKTKVEYSYVNHYKELRISTIDNVDTSIGKTSLILAMEGRPGNYGIKSEAEEFMPNVNHITSEE